MKKLFITSILTILFFANIFAKNRQNFYAANDNRIQYMGRIDFTDPLKPTMWATATQVQFSFEGNDCSVKITDQVQYGTNHNYVDIIVDGNYKRIKLTGTDNEVVIAKNLPEGIHTAIISKSTEAGIGYIKFEGIYCKVLIRSSALPSRKIEFFGDSITSGMGSDTTEIGCHKAEWYDQTNGYKSYGALTARALQAQYQITSASGIGLIHSCCNMDIVMPQVYDKVDIRENKIVWDFKKYQPDVVSICLGQNDGLQDSASFCGAYIKLIKDLRAVYPNTKFICLSSPMGDAALTAQSKRYLPAIAKNSNDKNIAVFYFSRSYNSGCDYHPSLLEHEEISEALTSFIKREMNWKLF